MNLSLNINSFNSICRTCLGSDSLCSIYESNIKYSMTYSEILSDCTLLVINKEDKLPLSICKKCKRNLLAFYKFKCNVQNTNALLQKILNETKADISTGLDESHSTDAYESLPILKETEVKQEYTPILERELSVIVKGHKRKSTEEDISTVLDESLLTDADESLPILKETEVKQEYTPILELEQELSVIVKGDNKKIPKVKLEKKLHQCDSCGTILSSRSNLIKHIRKHTGEKPFECDVCKKTFGRKEQLSIHKRIHTGERPYSCTKCDKSFVQLATLTSHLRTHTGEKPHMCSMCGKSFSQLATLKYHIRAHSGETPFDCKLCDKKFACSWYLKTHMRFHNKERPFGCNLCDKRFVTNSNLAEHIKQHTGDRPHKCNVCDKTFARSENLKLHRVIHTGEKPHCCQICLKRYTQRSHLSRHMKTHKS